MTEPTATAPAEPAQPATPATTEPVTAAAATPEVTAVRDAGPDAPDAGPGSWDRGSLLRGALLVLVPLLLAGWCLLLVRDLWVMTEARVYLHVDLPLDPVRFLLRPNPDWGVGRLASVAFFRGVGRVCDLDGGCVNVATAGLTFVAALLIAIHGWQLSGSAWLGILAAALWGLSAPVLAGWLWQATWFDLLATIAAIGAGIFWWWVFGRKRAGPGWWLLSILGSLVLIAVAFNVKEVDYLLVGVLLLLAVVRGATVHDGIRRNLIAATMPALYGIGFIGTAMRDISPEYAASVGAGHTLTGLRELVTQALGVASSFAMIDRGPDALPARAAAAVLWVVFGVALLGCGIAAVRHVSRVRSAARAEAAQVAMVRVPSAERVHGGVFAAWGAELYLLALGGGATFLGARSAGLSTYYGIVPAAAFTLLVLLVIRRIARASARPKGVAGLLTGLLVLAWGVAYVGLFVNRDAAVWQVRDDSARLRSTAALVRTLLAGRDVTQVAWRPDGVPPTGFSLLRDPGKPQREDGGWRVGPEVWPWLMGDKVEVPVTSLDEGTADDWRARLDEHAAPGEVLLVTDPDDRLGLLAIGGEVLYPPPPPASPAP
ncbi:MAG: hypothetical protein U0869_21550 [Chloroflexota bacterium]